MHKSTALAVAAGVGVSLAAVVMFAPSSQLELRNLGGILILRNVGSTPITVNEVVVNEGNCSFVKEPRLPSEVPVGKTFAFLPACSPVRLVVKTNYGDVRFSYSELSRLY